MAFDLTNLNISDTFQHLLQVRADDKTIYDLKGNTLDDFRLSGSFTTSEFLELENTDSVTGNKLHSRAGTLYWGGSAVAGGISELIEDITPQLGGSLDLNGNNVSGSSNFLINGSGSFTQINIGATSNTFDAFFNVKPASVDKNIFLVQSGSLESIKVNQTGVINFGGFATAPTVVTGGLYYNTTDGEFYLGT